MKWFSRALWLIIGFYVLSIFLEFSEGQRSYFGEEAGNLLFNFEAFVLFGLCLCYFFWKKGKKREVILGIWLLSAILSAFIKAKLKVRAYGYLELFWLLMDYYNISDRPLFSKTKDLNVKI